MNDTPWRLSLFGFVIGGLLACTMAPAAGAERAALESAIQRWVNAVNAQDVGTLTGTMTEDVEILDANAATVEGRDAAIRALREVASRGRLVATSREITIAHDVAWHVVGLVQTQKNGDVQARGQALEIWKRVDGAWKLHRRMTAGADSADLLKRPSPAEPVLDPRGD